MKDPIEKIKDILDVLRQDGPWNCGSYSRGLYNGIELAYSILVGKNPDYKKKPEPGLFVAKKEKLC